MENIETLFQEFRASVFVVVFILAFYLQKLEPFRASEQNQILKNWKVNLPLGILNSLLAAIICGGCVCLLAADLENTKRAFLANQIESKWVLVFLTIVILDLVSYLWHRTNHGLEFLWRFHASHHSDAVIDSSSAIRFHPVEVLLSIGVRLVVVASIGLPVIGLFAFELLYLTFNIFEHSHVAINKKFEFVFGLLFVTPSMHRWHHSTKILQANSNYGTVFSIWDRALGTLQMPVEIEKIEVGLPGYTMKSFGLAEVLLIPFKEGRR